MWITHDLNIGNLSLHIISPYPTHQLSFEQSFVGRKHKIPHTFDIMWSERASWTRMVYEDVKSFLKRLIHLKLAVFFNTLFPYITVINISIISCGIFPSFAKNLMSTRHSACSSISIFSKDEEKVKQKRPYIGKYRFVIMVRQWTIYWSTSCTT